MRRDSGLRRVWTVGVMLAVLMVSASASAASWGRGNGGSLSMKELVPRMSEEEAYSERYGFAVDLDGGGHVGVDFTISNLGWGTHNGAYEVRARIPGHKKYKTSGKLDDDEWSYSKSSFGLRMKSTRVDAVGRDGFRLRHSGRVSFDLTFKNSIPMWKPGKGVLEVDGGYYAFHIIAPRADVSGTVTIDGQSYQVKGTRAGYGDHVATNVAPFDLAQRFTRMRHYNGDVFVIWREITLAEDHGGRSLTWVMVGYKGQVVFSDANARLRAGRERRDPKSDYVVPLAIQIDGKDGADQIKLVMKGPRYRRKDLLDSYGSAAKMVASAFTSPVRYTVKSEYELQMTIGGAKAKVGGTTDFVIDQLN